MMQFSNTHSLLFFQCSLLLLSNPARLAQALPLTSFLSSLISSHGTTISMQNISFRLDTVRTRCAFLQRKQSNSWCILSTIFQNYLLHVIFGFNIHRPLTPIMSWHWNGEQPASRNIKILLISVYLISFTLSISRDLPYHWSPTVSLTYLTVSPLLPPTAYPPPSSHYWSPST